MALDFSLATPEAGRQWSVTFRIWRGNHFQLKILYPRTTIQVEGGKTHFQIYVASKNFASCAPFLRKLQEDVLSPNKDIKKKEVDMVSKKNKNRRHRGMVKSLENAQMVTSIDGAGRWRIQEQQDRAELRDYMLLVRFGKWYWQAFDSSTGAFGKNMQQVCSKLSNF